MKLEAIKEELKKNRIHWHYRAALVSLYHHLMQNQQGKAPAGRYGKGWSIRDTARDLDLSIGTVASYLKLDEAIIGKPELKKLSIKKAMKLL